VLRPLGLALIALSAVTVAASLAVPMARRRRPARSQWPTHHAPADYRTALDELRRLSETGDTGDPDALRQAFGRLDHLLRERLAESGIEARSLTPDEIDSQAGAGDQTTNPRAVAALLRECERIRYGGARQRPSRDLLAQAIGQAETVLAPGKGLDR
jgi:hypothetical protein